MATWLVRPLYKVEILCNFLDLMFRPPAFYDQFSLKILVAVQSRFYCISYNFHPQILKFRDCGIMFYFLIKNP